MTFNAERYWSTRRSKAWFVEVETGAYVINPRCDQRLIRSRTQTGAEELALSLSRLQYPRIKSIRLATPDDILDPEYSTRPTA